MPPLSAQKLAFLTSSKFTVRSRRKVRLGPLGIEIRSNEERFIGMRYFPHSSHAEDEIRASYTVSFCNLNVDAPWPLQMLLKEQDKTYRAKRFAAGYYITDHFGPPAYLVTRGTHYWIFGSDFEPIFWPYVVKFLLTLYSMQQEMLHLKAAGIAVDGAGTVLVGRGGGGKTVLLTRLCQRGAQFLSNTHTLIDEQRMIAVPAAMRVRNDPLFAPMITARQLPTGLKAGEYLADPLADLDWRGVTVAPVRNVCLVDYRGPNRCDIREIDRDILFDYMEQFSLALNVYGLKEDILDHLGGDVTGFSDQMQRIRLRLRALVDRCSCYYVSCDATNDGNLAVVYDLFAPKGVS
jgi:hypothetical protein